MSDTKRPLPRLDDADTGEFWRRTQQRQLSFQRCRDCGNLVFYPRRHCSSCGSQALEWLQSAGTGCIYSFSVVRQSYHPYFRSQAPYAVAWIDLDEGIRILSNITGVDDPGSQLCINQRVVVDWEVHDNLCIPLFRPQGSACASSEA